jgi:hypothetical protein
VALAGPRRGADDLGQERLRGGVAMQDVVLAAFLVIDDELDRDAGIVRPARMRDVAAIADHVAGIAVGGHGPQLPR